MKKRILVSILLLMISFLGFYFIASFITFDLNPKNWDFGMRAFTAVFGTFVGIFIIAIYNMNGNL